MGFFYGKKIFLTGHTGFKGSWLSRMLVLEGADVTGYALEPDTTPNLFSLTGIKKDMNSVIGDIRDYEHLKKTFDAVRPEIVIHLAAQPLVRESYQRPLYTYETNVIGTVNLLECVRLNECVRSFLNVTTDKVYENIETERGYVEEDKLDGYDPYSGSKSCSELVTHAYFRSFFSEEALKKCNPEQRSLTSISTARAGNVIGGGDFSKNRIIPDCVRAAMNHEDIVLRNPDAVRPFQHVLDPLGAYLLIVKSQWENPEKAGWYNIGPDESDCISVRRLADIFCRCWGEGIRMTDNPDGGPHEAGLLKLDCSKIKKELGWKPVYNISDAVAHTVEWSKAYSSGSDVSAEMDREIKEFIRKQND